MKMQLFRSTAAATIAVAAFILCYSAHASTRSTAGTPWEPEEPWEEPDES